MAPGPMCKPTARVECTNRRAPKGRAARPADVPSWPAQPGSANRRKIATAFWPPNPKPLIIAVSTCARLFTNGT